MIISYCGTEVANPITVASSNNDRNIMVHPTIQVTNKMAVHSQPEHGEVTHLKSRVMR